MHLPDRNLVHFLICAPDMPKIGMQCLQQQMEKLLQQHQKGRVNRTEIISPFIYSLCR